MTVKRIVANFSMASSSVDETQIKAFYQQVFGLGIAMDLGWIFTFVADHADEKISDQAKAQQNQFSNQPQLSFASEGGNGTEVPDISIEVDDVDEVYRKAVDFGSEVVYGLCDEPWGVRRFFVRDPLGKTLNIMSHL